MSEFQSTPPLGSDNPEAFFSEKKPSITKHAHTTHRASDSWGHSSLLGKKYRRISTAITQVCRDKKHVLVIAISVTMLIAIIIVSVTTGKNPFSDVNAPLVPRESSPSTELKSHDPQDPVVGLIDCQKITSADLTAMGLAPMELMPHYSHEGLCNFASTTTDVRLSIFGSLQGIPAWEVAYRFNDCGSQDGSKCVFSPLQFHSQPAVQIHRSTAHGDYFDVYVQTGENTGIQFSYYGDVDKYYREHQHDLHAQMPQAALNALVDKLLTGIPKAVVHQESILPAFADFSCPHLSKQDFIDDGFPPMSKDGDCSFSQPGRGWLAIRKDALLLPSDHELKSFCGDASLAKLCSYRKFTINGYPAIVRHFIKVFCDQCFDDRPHTTLFIAATTTSSLRIEFRYYGPEGVTTFADDQLVAMVTKLIK